MVTAVSSVCTFKKSKLVNLCVAILVLKTGGEVSNIFSILKVEVKIQLKHAESFVQRSDKVLCLTQRVRGGL